MLVATKADVGLSQVATLKRDPVVVAGDRGNIGKQAREVVLGLTVVDRADSDVRARVSRGGCGH